MANKEDIGSKHSSKTGPKLEGLADAAKVVQDAAAQILEFSRDAADSAGHEFQDKAKLAEDVISSGVKSSTKLIKKYPLESALVCFGVGIVAGLLLNKRD